MACNRYSLPLILAISLLLSACGDGDREPRPAQTAASPTARQTPAAGDDGEPATPGTPGSVVDTKAPGSEMVAFVSERDGNKEIYVMGADGSGLRRLTNTAADEEFPVWSPDGRQIAFVSTFDSTTGQPPFEYFLVSVAGSGLTKLAETDVLSVPPAIQWSPDGSRLALQLNVDGEWGVYLVNADGTGLTSVSAGAPQLLRPVWSPDGSRIAIWAGKAPEFALLTVNPDGTELRELTDNGWLPSWSPDSSRIAFATDRDGNTEVYLMNADGSEPVNVSQSAGVDGPFAGIVWSPDGSRLAFGSHREGAADLFLANADGSGLTALTDRFGPGESRIDQIVWSPDGSRIAFAASISHSMAPDDIFVVNADGSGLVNLTNTATKKETIVGWSHDGERIFYVGEHGPAVPTTTASGVEVFLFDFDIFVMNADGSERAALAHSPGREGMAALWSGE